LVQATRLAEMDGKSADRDRLKAEADDARKSFLELSDVVKGIQKEIDERTAAKEEKEKGEKANANAAGK
jgi:hypothetical protein